MLTASSLFLPLHTIVVVIHEADSLTRDAQAALRRTMEKYMSNMRLILCANSTSKLIAPIRSRCLLMRVAAPSEDEVSNECSPPAVMFAPLSMMYGLIPRLRVSFEGRCWE